MKALFEHNDTIFIFHNTQNYILNSFRLYFVHKSLTFFFLNWLPSICCTKTFFVHVRIAEKEPCQAINNGCIENFPMKFSPFTQPLRSWCPHRDNDCRRRRRRMGQKSSMKNVSRWKNAKLRMRHFSLLFILGDVY